MTAGGDGRVNVWNVSDASRIDTFAGHAGAVSGIAISPDGRTVYSAGEDGNVVEWDLTGARRFGRSFTTPRRGRAGAGATARRPRGGGAGPDPFCRAGRGGPRGPVR